MSKYLKYALHDMQNALNAKQELCEALESVLDCLSDLDAMDSFAALEAEKVLNKYVIHRMD